jgi:hypothetical protein
MSDAQRIKELEEALLATVAAMKESQEVGCTEHLDCASDGGAFWYDAIENAEKLLNK